MNRYNYERCGSCLLPEDCEGATAQVTAAMAEIAALDSHGAPADDRQLAMCMKSVVDGRLPWDCVKLLLTRATQARAVAEAFPALPLYVPCTRHPHLCSPYVCVTRRARRALHLVPPVADLVLY